jgi:hypothetical protein
MVLGAKVAFFSLINVGGGFYWLNSFSFHCKEQCLRLLSLLLLLSA